MKGIKIYFVSLLLICGLFSCQNYDPNMPSACLKVEKMVDGVLVESTNFKLGEDVYISSCGIADLYSVWAGDEGSDITKIDVRGVDKDGNTTWTNTGTSLSIKENAHVINRYNTVGSYTIVLVATNSSMGDTSVELVESMDQISITVTE